MVDVVVNFVHLLATTVWIGGAFYAHFILQPALKMVDPREGGKLLGILGKRFSIAAATSLLLLAVTGVMKTPSEMLLDTTSDMGVILTVKHILFAGIMIVGLSIGLYVIPNIKKNVPQPGEVPSPRFLSFQKKLDVLALINLVLGILVLVFASQLW